MSQSDVMKYARKQVTDHGHATLEGVRGIRTDVPIRSSVRSPFPPFRIKSKQMVKRLNAELHGGWNINDILNYISTHGGDLTAKYLLTGSDPSLPNAVVVSAYPFADVDLAAIAWSKVSGKPSTFPPSLHASTHELLGNDILTIDWSQLLSIPSTFPPSAHGAAAHSGSIIPTADQNFGEQEALAFRVENVATLPSSGNKGRLCLQLTDNKVYYDNGSAWVAM